eukprot:GHUV01047693.1.p2 GENE.GHUV01047693.1~~GHUV01047693.1.p2  ORF type:complete len:110 (-),score=20.97 GHUV01047693.1:17-346(-)
MSPTNAKALNTMRQRLKKHNTSFELVDHITKFRWAAGTLCALPSLTVQGCNRFATSSVSHAPCVASPWRHVLVALVVPKRLQCCCSVRALVTSGLGISFTHVERVSHIK